ncbi:MAG: protein kinase [Scytonema sp. PMC 1069.18]|nr:protein kinase [Scytonema sp. PMC 1069.18]MEC4880752.1 protein kinase [Scytonema sp. PMC 1070.18]
MDQKQPDYSNNEQSSEPTNQFPKEKIHHDASVEAEDNVFNWEPGQNLKNGRYIIQKKLKWGGFADIYLAQNTEEKQDVVLKTLKNELRNQDEIDNLEENFVKEAISLAKLKHPHIVQFKDVIKTPEGWCIVMEYIEGEDLHSWVRTNGILSETDALLYIRQIGNALIEVHNQGLLHRDIKPQNIIRISDGSKAVLIDFGISRKYSPNKTEQHTPYLTPDFAPPEQYEEEDKRGAYIDVYALAATLYFLLTERNPTSARARQSGTPLKHPQFLNLSISNPVNWAIIMGMQIDPQERPQTIQAWLDLLPKNESKNSEPDASTIPPPNPQPCPPKLLELQPWIAVCTSPTSFLIALSLVSWLGTTWISAGFWLVFVLVLISISFFIVQGRRAEQVICLGVSSLIPTLVFFIFVPALRNWNSNNNVMLVVILTILAALVGFSTMSVYRQLSHLFRKF